MHIGGYGPSSTAGCGPEEESGYARSEEVALAGTISFRDRSE
jgi:hypothetical protein